MGKSLPGFLCVGDSAGLAVFVGMEIIGAAIPQSCGRYGLQDWGVVGVAEYTNI